MCFSLACGDGESGHSRPGALARNLKVQCHKAATGPPPAGRSQFTVGRARRAATVRSESRRN
eukprot:229833-Hanusia_phi.AAC.1